MASKAGAPAPSGTSGAHATLPGGAPGAAATKSENLAPKAVPTNAIDRLAALGSTLYTGMQAKPEAPKAAAPSTAAAPKAPPGAPKGPAVAAAGYMPSQMISNVVSSKPQAADAPQVQAWKTTPGIGGAAQMYASMASQALDASDPSKKVPREGPAAVAVARSIAAGKAALMMDGKLPKTSISKKYQIVLVSSELGPYSKTGGLGEAMDGLSVALAGLGHRVMVVTPRYDQYEDAWDTSFWSTVKMGGKDESVHFFHSYKQKVDQVFVDHPCFLANVWGKTGSKLYGPQFGEDYIDNQARFAYFCKAALVAIRQLPLAGYAYGDDVVVIANDWHAGLVPMFIQAEREMSAGNWPMSRTKVISLTHNAVYQGRFKLEPGLASVLGVSEKFVKNITFNQPILIGPNKKEATVNSLGAGLVYCDRALTVSPTYAGEISTMPEKGCEIQDLYAAKKCTGILNGIKEAVSPLNEIFLKKAKITCGPFTADTAAKAKAEMKKIYQKSAGLPASKAPMFCFIGRLDVQKGYDLLMAALEEAVPELEMQVVIIGTGRTDLVARTKALAKANPSKVVFEGWMGPERYAVLTGSDYTFFFSRWEPCGLVQMECMRLGTVPVVAPTGGLKDSVEDGVTGFLTDIPMCDESEVDKASLASITSVLRKVCQVYTGSPDKVNEMCKAAMAAAAQFTWTNAALQYEAVFEEMGVVNVLPQVASAEGATVTLQEDNVVC
jgi:granule-bound starch synthase